jgi:hypothetical protein
MGEVIVHKGFACVAVTNKERLCVNHPDQRMQNLMANHKQIHILPKPMLGVVMCVLGAEDKCSQENLDQITLSSFVHCTGPKKKGLCLGYDSTDGLFFLSREAEKSIAAADVAPGTTVFFCDTKDWECRENCTGECKYSGQFDTFEVNERPFSRFLASPVAGALSLRLGTAP